MKYAIALLFILALWFVAAQSISLNPAYGYEAKPQDQILLQKIYKKIDILKKKNPQKLSSIDKKLPKFFPLFPSDSQESFILHTIYIYIHHTLNKNTATQRQQTNTTSSSLSNAMIQAIGEEVARK